MTHRLLLIAAVFVTPIAAVTQANAATTGSISTRLPHTRALDAELSGVAQQSRASAAFINQLRSDVRALRTDVDRARKVASNIRTLDRRLARLVSRMRVYASIPKVRTAVKFLSSNLKRVQGAVHSVRTKTDRFDSQVLTPLRTKLITMERKLYAAYAKLMQVNTATEDTRTRLSITARVAVHNSTTKRTLESTSRELRPVAARVRYLMGKANSKAGSIRSRISSVRRGLAAFWTVERSMGKTNSLLRPVDKVVGDLDRVLSKKISVKIPFRKRVSFSVKQILQKPGKLADKFLKPLEKLADKALQPVLRKLKLQLPAPAGLSELVQSLQRLPAMVNSVTASMQPLESFIDKELLGGAETYLNSFKSRFKSNAASHRKPTKSQDSTRNRSSVYTLGG